MNLNAEAAARLERLRALNPTLEIRAIESEGFLPYGRLLPAGAFSAVFERAGNTPVPGSGNEYIADDPSLYTQEDKAALSAVFFGGQEIQIGRCNGQNACLNALEYHKSSEINLAATDLLLILGKVQDISEDRYDTGKTEIFFLPAETAVELYATTLHFSPCRATDMGFRAVVILPAGTNTPLPEGAADRNQNEYPEKTLLRSRNKWLLAHPAAKRLIDTGAAAGLYGENIEIVPQTS